MAVLALPLVLQACVDPAAPIAPPEPDPDACGAAALQGLVGQDRSVLATMRFDRPVRVVEHGMAVTMDFSAERLNFWLTKAGKIETVTCG
ncbi:MAG: hypothetical protein IAE87_01950 [Rhodobacteraceae bacterium]|nr:hypothetical protein [Paracoccaceae bacterium]